MSMGACRRCGSSSRLAFLRRVVLGLRRELNVAKGVPDTRRACDLGKLRRLPGLMSTVVGGRPLGVCCHAFGRHRFRMAYRPCCVGLRGGE